MKKRNIEVVKMNKDKAFSLREICIECLTNIAYREYNKKVISFEMLKLKIERIKCMKRLNYLYWK